MLKKFDVLVEAVFNALLRKNPRTYLSHLKEIGKPAPAYAWQSEKVPPATYSLKKRSALLGVSAGDVGGIPQGAAVAEVLAAAPILESGGDEGLASVVTDPANPVNKL